jgi:predicted metal-dependent phosphoesterase TrpH
MHLLVYFVDGGEGPLQDRLGELQRARAERNTRMVDVLSNDLGLPITLDEVQAEAGGDGVGRPHVAAVLVRNGVVATIGEAFDQFLAKGRPGYVDRERLRPEDAMRLAAASGGVTVLAHPSTLAQPPGTLAATIAELAAAGLAGVEAFYGRYGPGEREEIAALARRHGLVPTGGSDHHGAYKPDLRVGVGRGDLDVPDEALAALRERRP